jgi:hypothetical protein
MERQVKYEMGVMNEAIVGFEVITAVIIESTIFWDVTPCSLLKVNQPMEEHISSIFSVEETQ